MGQSGERALKPKMIPLFGFFQVLQSKGPKEDAAGADEEVGDAFCLGGQLVSLREQEHGALVHGAHPVTLQARVHVLVGAEQGQLEGVPGGQDVDLVAQVERFGRVAVP